MESVVGCFFKIPRSRSVGPRRRPPYVRLSVHYRYAASALQTARCATRCAAISRMCPRTPPEVQWRRPIRDEAMTTEATFTPATLDALVRLLADDDARIRGIAREKLAGAGDRALDVLRDRAAGAEDPRVRTAAEEFLRDAKRAEALRRWDASVRSRQADLEAGAFLIAQSEYPDLDPAPYRRTLDEFAQVLERRLGAIRSPDHVFERLSALLFTDLGFKGNRERYHD